MDWSLPLVSFAFVSSITPGPNNVMLSASGVAFGLRRTLPHLFGVALGFALLLALCGGGVGALISGRPSLALALRVVGSAYLLHLAWKLCRALAPSDAGTARPCTFGEAVLFQFVNPKAWVMGVTAGALFVQPLGPRWLAVASMCAVFSVVNLPCIFSWALLGATLRRWLADERWRRRFGVTVGALTAYSVGALWI